jgi:hypothetical protein
MGAHRYTKILANLCSEHQVLQFRLGNVVFLMTALFYRTLLRDMGTQFCYDSQRKRCYRVSEWYCVE